MAVDVLSPRALNRATLERQLLLRRVDMTPLAAVEHLVGLQAQEPLNPYHALWSRLEGFDPEDLSELLLDRKVVRLAVMRGTIHLVTADDALVLRPLVQSVLDREIKAHPEFAPLLDGVDVAPVLAFARAALAEKPHTGGQLRTAIAERFPGLPAAALAYACRCHLALVQVPPRGLWGKSAQVSSTTAEAWLGRPLVAKPSIDDVVLRYLAAFGPALVADAAAWSRLQRMREVFDRLRPRLRTFRDERGRELFDLDDAPRPDPDTQAPTRFLPEYDNVLLSHDDRSRFAADDAHRVGALFSSDRPVKGAVLFDGLVRATWWIDRDRDNGAVTLMVDHSGRLAKRDAGAVASEGRRLLSFLEPGATGHDVRLTPLG